MPIYERMTIQGRGGALPQYQSNQTPYVPGQGINARVSGADAEILARGYNMEAKAMEGLAKAGKNAVDVGLQAADDYAKTKAVELATKYKMGMRQSMYGEGGILTREGENAFTANADTMKRSKELRAELLKDLAGSLVAQKFNAAIDPEEAEYSLKAQEYEGKQYRVFQDRTDKAAFSEAAEMAITGYADPKSFAKGTGEALWFQEQILRRQGYSGEALERGLKESSSKIFAGGIEQALAADDLASARRLLKQGEGTRMTADDVAKAKKAIDTKAEALEKKAEAEKAKADFKAAADKVTTILDSAEDEKAALEQVEKLAGDDAEKRDLYMKAWDSVTKQRNVDAARKQTAKDNAFFSGLDDRVKDMSAQELTGYILGLTDPDHQKGAKLAWERQHGQAPVVLVSDEVHLQQVYDDVAKGQKSVDRILLEHDGHISDEDAMKVRQAAAKAGAEKAKEVEKMKVELVTKKDDMKPFLKTLKLDGSKLSDEQLRKKNLFMYAAQDRINGFISTHKRPPSYEEKVKLLDELTVEVVKGGWFTPDTLAYELYESEPPRGANLPERAVWQYLPGEKRWTWVDPVSGAAMKKEDVERAKGGF